MRHIDLETWPRREHFKAFNALDYPHFSLCANVDLSAAYALIKQRGISFNLATVYILTRAANAIPEFRYRIREGAVIEHEIVHPSTTILSNNGLFSFCSLVYLEDFTEFAAQASERIAYVKEHPSLTDKPGQDDLLYMTAVPWVSFTSLVHPIHMHPPDSVPMFAWGKFFTQGERLLMPLSVQGHHALMDGEHLGKFYAEVQSFLDQPDFVEDKT